MNTHLSPIAVTKLRAPTLPSRVIGRDRIGALLDRSIASPEPLTLVSAPAGAGKSTALACWLMSRPELASIWLQVDEADNDPIRFWSGLLAALDSVASGLFQSILPVLRAPKTTFNEGALPVLVNTLDRVERDLVMVFDDYHVISNAEIHEGIQALVDGVPEHVTVVLSSRIDPPLRLGRLRVRGQLTEIRAKDLRFDATEASYFFDGQLAAHDVDVLCDRTEGWAAGLVLAAASLARSADRSLFVQTFAGDDRLVVDYLTGELWENLEQHTKDRMLATSILDEMCGSLVDAVAGTDDGASWLERYSLENQLLISLDGHRHWYRYHTLLGGLLRSELERASREQLTELHRRAAAWYVANGAHDDAIRHTFASGDLSAAADLVGAQGSKIFSEGHLVTVQGWLDRLGPELVTERAWCSVLQAWTMIVAGEFDDVDRWLIASEELIRAGAAGDDAALLAGSVAAASALTAIKRGDVGGALHAAERIGTAPEEQEVTPLVSGIVGICRCWAGSFEEATPVLESSARMSPASGDHLIGCTSTMFLAIVAIENDDLGRARHYARQALDQADDHSLTEYHQIALAHSVLARTTFDETPEQAFGSADRGVSLARRSNEPIMLAYALATRAEIAVLDDRVESADVDLTEARNLLRGCVDPGMVLTFVARREAQLGSAARGSSRRISTGLVEDLTDRELTIVRLLPSRLTVREIGSELHISQNTVKGHIKAIYRKLGVNSRTLAVQRAHELCLL